MFKPWMDVIWRTSFVDRNELEVVHEFPIEPCVLGIPQMFVTRADQLAVFGCLCLCLFGAFVFE